VLEANSVPIRVPGSSYFTPELIPEGAVRDRFKLGEVVYSTRYDSTARIDAESFSKQHGWIYRVWLLAEKWQQNTICPPILNDLKKSHTNLCHQIESLEREQAVIRKDYNTYLSALD
jgi:hypothetical protein